ncbi:MAG: site-specific integrase [Solirubrobacteraceae bacterium]|nr:site-specific integrase [Solirubrobacteraceae bacterium]
MSIEPRDTAAGRRYLVRWRENGKQRSRTFVRAADAEAWDLEVRRRQQLGPLAVTQLTGTAPTLNEYTADVWVPQHAAALAPRTQKTYAALLKARIIPTFGTTPLNRITSADVRAWQAQQTRDNAGPTAIRRARMLLGAILQHALENEVVTTNPVAIVKPPRKPRTKTVRPLAPSTVEALRQVVAQPMPVRVPEGKRKGARRAAYDMPDKRDRITMARDATLVAVLAYAGLRPGEALALRWEHVRDKTLLIEDGTDGEGKVKATKTEHVRTVRLLGPLAADLKAWRLTAGRPPARALVFPRPDDGAWTTIDWNNWRDRTWTAACERADLDPVPRPYDLRHSFASLLLAEGRSVHYVARQLGHGPELTLRTYGHVMDEFEDAATIDADAEIRKARAAEGVLRVSSATAAEEAV